MSKETIFVDFEHYCDLCEHCDEDESYYICDECLSNPVNLYTDKPVNFKEKE